jgi:hypothetical protein
MRSANLDPVNSEAPLVPPGTIMMDMRDSLIEQLYPEYDGASDTPSALFRDSIAGSNVNGYL